MGMRLHVGTSGYSYDEWKGSFYPEDLPGKKMLHYYAQQLQAVEINYTFRRIPKTSVLENWAAEVPADFQFVLKAPQRITHIHRLKNTDDTLRVFLNVAEALQERLGPILFQLPPNFKKDTARLGDFLSAFRAAKKRMRAALEFRHASWFDDATFEVLRKHDAALCIAEAEDGVEVPFVSTADWGYIRLRRPDYGAPELKQWLKDIRGAKWNEAFVFFKHEEEGVGPKLAAKFLKLAE